MQDPLYIIFSKSVLMEQNHLIFFTFKFPNMLVPVRKKKSINSENLTS